MPLLSRLPLICILACAQLLEVALGFKMSAGPGADGARGEDEADSSSAKKVSVYMLEGAFDGCCLKTSKREDGLRKGGRGEQL